MEDVYSKELLRRFTPLEVLVYGYLLALVVNMLLLVWVEPLSIWRVRTYTRATWTALFVLSGLVGCEPWCSGCSCSSAWT